MLRRLKKARVDMPRRPARFTQSDIARALRAIEQVGVKAAVKLAADGNIWIVQDNGHGENPQLAKERVAVDREAML